MQVDYLELSKLYASFLAALGGVSITVLTLVLGFYSKLAVGNLRFCVAALSVATISCFTGAHLMAETAAFISRSKELFTVAYISRSKESLLAGAQESLVGERLFFFASINIYVGAMLLIFTVVLLTAEHVKWISVLVFSFVLLITLRWMYVTATSRFEEAKLQDSKKAAWWAIGIGVIVCIVMCIWAASQLFEKYLLLASFVLPVVFTALSFWYFVRVFNFKGFKSKVRELWLYSLAIALPCISLFGAGMGLVLRK